MLYVINDDKNMIYRVTCDRPAHIADNVRDSSLTFDLTLVAGKDYIEPDHSDRQWWVTADGFIEDVQYDTVFQYFLEESLEYALQQEGYTILDTLPHIYRFGLYPLATVAEKDL